MAHNELEQGQLNVEPPDFLPSGWKNVSLAEVVTGAQGGFASGSKAVPNGLKHLRMNNIGEEGTLVLDLLRTVPPSLAKAQHRLEPGDVLVCTTNSGKLVGKCALFNEEGVFAFSNHITRLRPRLEVVDPNFLRWTLWLVWKSGGYDEFCQHWVNQSTLPKDALLATRLLLPPLREQRRMTSAIGAVLGRVKVGRERLEKVPTILKRFRQSILVAAASGRLTAQWREGRNLDATKDLLPLMKLRGKSIELQSDLIKSLPSNWVAIEFKDLMGELRNGIGTKPQMAPPGLPILRINAVRPGKVLFDDVRYMPDSDELAKVFSLKVNDLLFTRYNGSIELLGVCGMVRSLPFPALLYPDKLMRVRFDHECALPEYIEIFFQSPEARDRLMDRAKSSAGQQGISGKDIKEQIIAFPPIDEQREIVRRTNALFSLADRIEGRVVAASERADKLIQSTLAKAFRGELIPTEHALQQANASQQVADGMAVLQVLALLYTWKASPDRRAFELGMILMQHGVLRTRVLKSARISTVSAANVTPPKFESFGELISELVGSGTLQLEQRKVSQLVKLGANAPAEASLVGTSVGKAVFAQAQEAVRAVESLKQLGQSLDQYATAEEYDAIEIAIS